MYNKQGFQSDHKGGCGSMGRGKWGRGKFGGFWGGPMGGRHGWGFQQTPVNIQETETEFILSVFAAGIVKENVTLSVKDDVLTIAYTGSESTEKADSTTANYTHQEHGDRSFERAFRLNEKVLTESISASYANGILKVILPKNPATNKPAQTISVA
ncbi:Hsp20/alpha crystallin family protein [Spirosoma aerophilum]